MLTDVLTSISDRARCPRPLAVALLILSGTGCASVGTPGASGPASGEPATVRVRNDGSSTETIYGKREAKPLGTVRPGQSTCLRIEPTRTGEEQLVAEPSGGGPTISTTPFQAKPGEGWSWTVPGVSLATDSEIVPGRPCGATSSD